MTTHNICFMENLGKLSFDYQQIPFLSVLLFIWNLGNKSLPMSRNKVTQQTEVKFLSVNHRIKYTEDFFLMLSNMMKCNYKSYLRYMQPTKVMSSLLLFTDNA